MTDPPVPHRGDGYAALRREVEHAVAFAALAESAKGRDIDLLRARIDRYRRDHPAGEFRPAVDSAERRLEAVARGELPAVTAATGPPQLGQAVPDVTLAEVGGGAETRLLAVRGRPTVAIVYKPRSETSAGALAVADALARRFPTVRVVPLAVFADREAAAGQRAELKLTLPVYEGSAAVGPFGIDTFPRFLLIDADGVLRWQFEGFGPEVGYLVRGELERPGK
jgi:hypothetical protein